MNTVSFLNQPLLWGLTLASIPLIIHLLFRRRFRRLDWAPMRYLKLSIQRNRRRIRLEQILLLLARTAIIVLLFLAVARPVMHAAGLASWLGGGSGTSQILVIDDSLSMGYRDRGQTALQRAKDLAAEIIRTVGPKDRFTLVLSSQPKMPLVREVEVTDSGQIQKLVRDLKPADAFASWEPIAHALDELITSSTYPIRELTIVTDLRRAGWDKDLAELGGRWAANRVRLRIFDVGSLQTDNIALASLEQIDRLALVGMPTRFEAEVRNHTSSDLEGLEANFLVDGQPTLVRLPAVAAGQSTRLPLLATFQETGLHHLSFKLPGDALPGDDQRWAIANVQDVLHVVLVDGEPSSEPLAGEVDFLALAMSLGSAETAGFRVDVVADSELTAAIAARPDLIVTANVATFSPEHAEALSRLVRSGTGLMIFLGEQIDPDNYNQLLYKGGTGLLPAALESVVDEETAGIVVENDSASPLKALTQLSAAVLERVHVRKFYQVRASSTEVEAAHIVARWNNPSTSPAVLAKTVGQGQVLLWTTTADKNWSDWPIEPSYVLATREAATAIARSTARSRAGTAGEPLRRPVDANHAVSAPAVETPNGDEPRPAHIEQTTKSDKPDPTTGQTLVFAETQRSGLYRLTWHESPGGAAHDLFAVNPDARESDLARIPADELRKLWGTLDPEVIAAAQRDAPLAVRGQEMWRSLAAGLLGLLVIEACFATWTGRQH